MKGRVIEIIGGIHAAAGITEQPEIILERWSVKEVSGYLKRPGRTRHFVGWNVVDVEGRASTAICEFDPTTRRGRTESGRVYELRGDSGYQADAAYIWKRWSLINGLTEETDVTAEYLPRSPLAKEYPDSAVKGNPVVRPAKRPAKKKPRP